MEWYTDRGWMSNKNDSNGFLNSEYCDNVDLFLDFAFSNEAVIDMRVKKNGETIHEIKCPCFKCQNTYYRDRDTVQKHLYKEGFMPHYVTWSEHGENSVREVGQSSTAMEIDEKLWLQVSGGKNKGKVYGLRNLSNHVHERPDSKIEMLNKDMKELVKEKEEEKERLNGIIEELRTENEIMLNRMTNIEEMVKAMARNG